MSSSGLGGSAAVGLGRLPLSAIGTPSADPDARATPRRAGGEHLGSVGGDQDGVATEDRPQAFLPHIARHGQYHPWLQYLLLGRGPPVRCPHPRIQAQPPAAPNPPPRHAPPR